MKVFDKTISFCAECPMFFAPREQCKYDYHKITNYQQIDDNCAFNNQLTHVDFENYGFEYDEYTNEYGILDEFQSITMWYKFNGLITIFRNSSIIFKGVINSKPHLEFILQILNIN